MAPKPSPGSSPSRFPVAGGGSLGEKPPLRPSSQLHAPSPSSCRVGADGGDHRSGRGGRRGVPGVDGHHRRLLLRPLPEE